jgi:hypothetical protein
VLLCALLGLALYQRLTVPQSTDLAPRGKSAPPATINQLVPVTSLELSDVALSGGGAPFQIRGKLANHDARLTVSSITLRTTRRDCFEGALDPSGCVVIWQDQHWIRWSVPAQQAREFVETIWAHTPVPRARGTIKDEFDLIEATGVPTTTALQPTTEPGG